MTPFLDSVPLWWDREHDDQGRPIRADVRQVAQRLWSEAWKRAHKILGDHAEAAELLEVAVVHISLYLDRSQHPLSAQNAFSLLSLNFWQRVRRRASRLARIQPMGANEDIEGYAVLDGWGAEINRIIDFERIVCLLSRRSRTIIAMRQQSHDWKAIAEKLGIAPSTARNAFWNEVRVVLIKLDRGNNSREPGRE